MANLVQDIIQTAGGQQVNICCFNDFWVKLVRCMEFMGVKGMDINGEEDFLDGSQWRAKGNVSPGQEEDFSWILEVKD